MIPAVIERCAGIDVGKKFLAVCVMTGAASDPAKAETRKFGTIRSELEKLRLAHPINADKCNLFVFDKAVDYSFPFDFRLLEVDQ